MTYTDQDSGLRSAYPVKSIWNMWVKLKESGFNDRCSIRVFDGHIYTLMDDYDYYEGSGNRRRINSLLYMWDHLRECALKDEKEESFDWSSRKIVRNDSDQERLDLPSVSMDRDLQELLNRGDYELD